MNKKPLNGLAMALIVLGVGTIYVMQWGPSPLLVTIREQFGLTSDVAANMVVNIVFITIFIGCMTGTSLEKRVGTVALYTISLALVIAGAIVMALSGNSYVGTLIGRAVLGLGNGFSIPFFGSAVMKWNDEHGRETMNTANGMFPFFGAALGFIAALPLTAFFGGHWELALAVWAVLAAVALVVWIVFIRADRLVEYADEGVSDGQESEFAMYRNVLGRHEIRKCILAFICDFCCFSYISTIFPVLLFEASTMSEAMSATIAAVAFPLVGLGGSFAGGVLLAKTGLRKPFLVVAQIGKTVGVCIAVLLASVNVWFIVAGMAVFGFFNGLWMPALYCVPMDLKDMNPARAGAALALMMGIALLFGFIAPVVGGAITDVLSASAGLADATANHIFGLKWSLFGFGLLNMIGFVAMIRVPETGESRLAPATAITTQQERNCNV